MLLQLLHGWTRRARRGAALAALALAGAAGVATPVHANDFPTLERVMWVHDCMAEHPGRPSHEMVAKCACALDRIAERVKFDDWSTMSTLAKALSIGGERGGALRENDSIKPALKAHREIKAEAEKACFLR